MNKLAAKAPPPDQAEREQALHPSKSILVQAPAGSGKTDLLTRRFLRLLAEIDEPEQILAITFTKSAAEEMRNRILSKLEEAGHQAGHQADHASREPSDPFSMELLARRALERSQTLGWNLLEQPARLRISTIDSFCRELALQRPMLSGLGDGLDIAEHPTELYRRAARRTLEQLDSADPALRSAIEDLLSWRDNNWPELENLLVQMLESRDRWMHPFLLNREPDWEALRRRLERPFAKAVGTALSRLNRLLDHVPEARDEALRLARFAYEHDGGESVQALAEIAQLSCYDPSNLEVDHLEEACAQHIALARLLLRDGNFRKSADRRHGFPADHEMEKARFLSLINQLSHVPGLESALAAMQDLPPARYPDEDWQILQSCFTLLRRSAGELQVVFAEAGKVDYIEVAQIAQNVLKGEEDLPSDAAIVIADKIRHILVDEFQDTSRRQHELLRRLVAAWPEREGRSCFVVGDPMQSIYFFRDADAELFPRVRAAGLEIPGADPLLFNSVALRSNFRTAKSLVQRLNQVFELVFSENDGSGITFSAAEPASEENRGSGPSFKLHLEFNPQPLDRVTDLSAEGNEAKGQTDKIIRLVRRRMSRFQEARDKGEKYRIAILGRTQAVLSPIAEALRKAAIPFRAVDLEMLSARPEVLDALALARALFNPLDRVSWLGVLRAPWCGLSLAELHTLTSTDDPDLLVRPVPELLAERRSLLSADGRAAAARLLDVLRAVPALRFARPAATLGTWLEQVWLRLGGAQCVDVAARANLDLLWQALDGLPDGEQDLLGPALDAALADLTALPDPAANSDCGVQLMTIHKSKGLEFEAVIVPDLQAGARKGAFRLLSWLERGLKAEEIAEANEEVTEFLVAPLQSKGADRGRARTWVERLYRERESQELRRLFYVAATRAREELHLFARPACKQTKDGAWELVGAKGTLLAIAWPALKTEIEGRFADWKAKEEAKLANTSPEPVLGDPIAVSAQGDLFAMMSSRKPTRLLRLPADFRNPPHLTAADTPPGSAIPGIDANKLYQRHEGGLVSRALGIAVHALLEHLAQPTPMQDWDAATAALSGMQPQIAAQIRSTGIAPQQAASLAVEAIEIASRAALDPLARWILSPHADAASEVRWVGVVDETFRTVQVDRVFRAGPNLQSDYGDIWWIIDYKTAHGGGVKPELELARLRVVFAPQLEAYAEVLRKLRGSDTQIRAGLYYPRMLKLDWWEL